MSEVVIPQKIIDRIQGKTWTVFVCAEPDGEDCDSGTHPNVLNHKCDAMRNFHESEGVDPGPKLLAITVERTLNFGG